MKKPKVVAIIQARMGSTRLPGKVMMPLAGKPILWHVIERSKKVKGVDEIVLATSTKKRDDVLAREAKKSGISVFRGSEDDVLARFVGAAQSAKGEILLRINADCPLFDPSTASELITILKNKKADAVFPDTRKGTAIGGFEVVTMHTLERIKVATTKPHDAFAHEHVTVYVSMNPTYYPGNKKFAKSLFIKPDPQFNIAGMQIAVDRPEDYAFMRAIYKRFYKKGRIIPLAQVVRFLTKHPKSFVL